MVVFIAREMRIAITLFPLNFLIISQLLLVVEHTIFKVKGSSEGQVQMKTEESQILYAGQEVAQG